MNKDACLGRQQPFFFPAFQPCSLKWAKKNLLLDTPIGIDFEREKKKNYYSFRYSYSCEYILIQFVPSGGKTLFE